MKRVIVIFVMLMMLQFAFYYAGGFGTSSRLSSLLWYLLIPGFVPFLFLPVSPEILVWHPSLVIFPILITSYFYTTVFALGWLAVTRLRKVRAH
jgi:hypothetical protein